MREKITKRTVEAIEPSVRETFLWDSEIPGFGCKVTPKGGRIYPCNSDRAVETIASRSADTASSSPPSRRETNPCRGAKRFAEHKVERNLSVDELGRLGRALNAAKEAGCRLGEVLNLRWSDVDIERRFLLLPDSKTGAKTVYLSEAAIGTIGKISRNPRLAPEARMRLMNAHLRLQPWADSVDALTQMRRAGLRLAYVSNFTHRMMATISDAAGVSRLFERQLSTDAVRAFKPDPRAYAMAEDASQLPRENILFAALEAGTLPAPNRTASKPSGSIVRMRRSKNGA